MTLTAESVVVISHHVLQVVRVFWQRSIILAKHANTKLWKVSLTISNLSTVHFVMAKLTFLIQLNQEQSKRRLNNLTDEEIIYLKL